MSGIERVCISVNSICNLKCTYCYFFLKPDLLPGPKALSRDDIYVILRNIQDYGRRSKVDKRIKVNFVGSGEPMLSWTQIREAILDLQEITPDHGLRFYMVTNALLLNARNISEMKELHLAPSVSLDGPASIHDRARLHHNGRGSHAEVMRGIERLREASVPVVINTTLGREVTNHLEEYFAFIVEQGFSKVIFDRLVDVPEEHMVSYAEFYATLRRIAELKESMGLHQLEIGNLEAYNRALSGAPDRVCTMFGSTCGAGFNNIIYMQREVYPCGRMFGQEKWKLGHFDEPLEHFPRRMAAIVGTGGCSDCTSRTMAGADCLLERERSDYNEQPRVEFVNWLGSRREMNVSI